MSCLLSVFIVLFRSRSIVIAGLLIVFAVAIGCPAIAEEPMMRHDRGNGAMRDVGTGLAIGVVTGIIINEMNKPGETTDSNKTSKKARKKTKLEKKQQPVKPADPEKGKTPETPPTKQSDTAPPEKPAGPAVPATPQSPGGDLPKTTGKENPTPPVAGPGPTTPPPAQATATAPTSVCGPDITDRVYATLKKIKKAYDDASPKQKGAACSSLYSLTDYNHAWDIEGLDPTTSAGYKKDKDEDGPAIPPAEWNPGTGTWQKPDAKTGKPRNFAPWFTGRSNACAIPRPNDACAATVQFEGTCQHAQIVNYVMWGAVNKLCSISSWRANMAILVRGISAPSETVEAQRDMMAVGSQTVDPPELNPREGMSFRERISPRQPAQFAQCTLTCPFKEPAQPTFNYIWVGLQ